jgi:hypothetical protein
LKFGDREAVREILRAQHQRDGLAFFYAQLGGAELELLRAQLDAHALGSAAGAGSPSRLQNAAASDSERGAGASQPLASGISLSTGACPPEDARYRAPAQALVGLGRIQGNWVFCGALPTGESGNITAIAA